MCKYFLEKKENVAHFDHLSNNLRAVLTIVLCLAVSKLLSLDQNQDYLKIPRWLKKGIGFFKRTKQSFFHSKDKALKIVTAGQNHISQNTAQCCIDTKLQYVWLTLQLVPT